MIYWHIITICIYGFKAGADDYIHKPFSPRQLVARVEAIPRRSSKVTAPVSLQCGELSLDPSRREVRLENGNVISLTALESRLLEYFMLHPGHILAMQDLIDHIWGPGGGDRDMLRQLVRRLRAKIEPDPANPIYIAKPCLVLVMAYGALLRMSRTNSKYIPRTFLSQLYHKGITPASFLPDKLNTNKILEV